jgi:hypothetical protein
MFYLVKVIFTNLETYSKIIGTSSGIIHYVMRLEIGNMCLKNVLTVLNLMSVVEVALSQFFIEKNRIFALDFFLTLPKQFSLRLAFTRTS